MIAGCPHVVRLVAHAEGRLGRQVHPAAPPADSFAQDFLGLAARIDIRRIEHVRPRVEAHIEQAGGVRHVAVAPFAKEWVVGAEGSGAETEGRHAESRRAQ
jgi:hypothetical protein